jgi:putative addiction module component (TIGR02574 family)
MKELGIDRLSLEERISLVREIWDSVASEAERSR